MRITRRPAWPVVFLLAAGACWGAEATGLGELQTLDREIQRWRRIQRPAGPEELEALRGAFAQATAQWVERWPGEELAWRERLRALAHVEAPRQAVEEALAGAEEALAGRPGLRFPEDTRFLMAAAAVRHEVKLDRVPGWLAEAKARAANELPAGNHPLELAYRRERLSRARWRAAETLAELRTSQRDAAGLEIEVRKLAAESAMAVPDPADRIAVAERARRRMTLFLWSARLARLEGADEAARRYYRRAAEARPVQPGEDEPLEHRALLEEAARFGVNDAAGTPIPPADKAGPHWLPTAQPLTGFEPDGRPAVAAIWDGANPRAQRAVERLRRQDAVRILMFPAASPEWIQRVNPLYTAPQLWVIDAAGIVRLVGPLQPGGDGWEEAVVGAARRLSVGP